MVALFGRTRDEAEVGASLMPPAMARALRRRGAELAGLALLAVGAALALLLATYDPNDPSFFNASSAMPTNLLGVPGAYAADPLARMLGWAAWGLPALTFAWGLRLLTHRGEHRVWSRLVLAGPAAICVGAMFASTHVPFESWPHSYGLGGLIGEAGDRLILENSPAPLSTTLTVMSVVLGALTVLLGGLALGLDRWEAAAALRWLWRGFSATLAALMGRFGRVLAGAARSARRRIVKPRSARVARPDPVGAARRLEPSLTDDEQDAPLPDGDDEDSIVARIAAAALRRDASRPGPDPDADVQRPPAPPVAHARKAAALSRKARKEAQPALALEGFEDETGYLAPPLGLLQSPTEIVRNQISDEALEENARMLETVLDDYGVRGEIVSVRPGPVVTMYELEPAPGLKASRVIGLADDIARSMSALAARVSTVPGRSVIGIELPNERREKVLLREILESKAFGDPKGGLLLALGKNIAGEAVISNLARMPHLLIAGTTGSGKSVAVNTMILSLLYRLSPKQCRLIMIDPKMLELSVYDGIPHLLSPVVTDPKKAVVALKWTVAEMEERYRKMSKMGVRNIEGYNAKVRDALAREEPFTRTIQTGFDEDTGEPIFETQEYEPEEMPFIVVIVDEMADLMMVAGKEIEACIQRLAQMARASGIHLIMATQRPSVDVITGTIKANFPTRISFQVTSKIDSRTILGEQGAEQLLGMGDMLYMAGGGRITRVHGPFVSDEEVEEIVNHLKALGEPDYVGGVTDGPDEEAAADIDLVLGLGGDGSGGEDELYDQAVAIVARDRKCSTSYIQRKLAIGYNKAARLVEQMEDQGVVSPANKVGKREILVGEV